MFRFENDVPRAKPSFTVYERFCGDLSAGRVVVVNSFAVTTKG